MSKWCCTVIHEKDGFKEGYFKPKNYGYRAILEIDGYTVRDLPENVGYAELRKAIKCMTGKEIPYCKDMIWEKLSDCEHIATIDATQPRKDCHVTLSERQNGWKPKWDEY